MFDDILLSFLREVCGLKLGRNTYFSWLAISNTCKVSIHTLFVPYKDYLQQTLWRGQFKCITCWTLQRNGKQLHTHTLKRQAVRWILRLTSGIQLLIELQRCFAVPSETHKLFHVMWKDLISAQLPLHFPRKQQVLEQQACLPFLVQENYFKLHGNNIVTHLVNITFCFVSFFLQKITWDIQQRMLWSQSLLTSMILRDRYSPNCKILGLINCVVSLST